jgi:pimeloyl-ACP methyl ester carboxylesterase
MINRFACVLLLVVTLQGLAQPTPDTTPASSTTAPSACPDSIWRPAPSGSRQLAVFLHAFNSAPETLVPAIENFLAERGPSDVLAPRLALKITSRTPIEDIVARLVLCMDQVWQQRGDTGYESIILVGHSVGSLLARKLYLVGMGALPQAPLEPELLQALRNAGADDTWPRRWAEETDRLVLFAGINRGWYVSHHMGLQRSFEVSTGLAANRVLQAIGMDPFTVMSARQGSPFITNLRLQWLARAQRTAVLPQVVQLLGTRDDLVPPDRNIDEITGKDFFYYEVPQSGHGDVILMDFLSTEKATCGIGSGPPRHAIAAPQARATVFRKALCSDLPASDALPQSISRASDQNIRALEKEVCAVVFVVHGIRDEGYWTERIGASARHAIEKGACKSVRLETSSYGFFPLLSFLRPGARQAKVEWLMDRYTEAKARYPDAQFHFIGHSHGTYLLWKALQDYPAVHFDRVVLAGSVLPTSVDWGDLIQKKRVTQVLNFTANADWVVGWFPNAMEMIGWQDVGGAGHYGFRKRSSAGIPSQDVAHPALVQFTGNEEAPGRQKGYVVGGHAAALNDVVWETIASFVADGTIKPSQVDFTDKHTSLVGGGANVAPLVWMAIATGWSGVLWLLLKAMRRFKWREAVRTLFVMAYLWLSWTILTQL